MAQKFSFPAKKSKKSINNSNIASFLFVKSITMLYYSVTELTHVMIPPRPTGG
jgi:hypothetical protein